MSWLGLKVYHKRWKKTSRKKKASASRLEKKAHAKRLRRTSARLRADPPKSERWFMEKYGKNVHKDDKFNVIFGYYIPDVQNKKYRYVIEIDGSFHDRPSQKLKDAKKDYYFNAIGYKMIRIKAYDDESFDSGVRLVLELRNAGPALDDNTAPGRPPRDEVASLP